MGFSIAGCVKVVSMFICYCIALSEFSYTIRKCRDDYYNDYYNDNYNAYYSTSSYYRYTYDSDCAKMKRNTATIGAGLGSCQLLFSIVVFFVALASSIYCCMAVCCESSSGPVVSTYTVPVHVIR